MEKTIDLSQVIIQFQISMFNLNTKTKINDDSMLFSNLKTLFFKIHLFTMCTKTS